MGAIRGVVPPMRIDHGPITRTRKRRARTRPRTRVRPRLQRKRRGKE